MSRENVGDVDDAKVDLVLRLYEAFNRRDEQALVALFDEDAEILSFAAAVEGDPNFRGHDGVRAWHRNLVETLGMIIEPRGFLPYRRLVLATPRIHVRTVNLQTTYDQGIVYEVRGDRILRSLGYKDVGSGLVAMGRLLLGAKVV